MERRLHHRHVSSGREEHLIKKAYAVLELTEVAPAGSAVDVVRVGIDYALFWHLAEKSALGADEGINRIRAEAVDEHGHASRCLFQPWYPVGQARDE